MKISSPNTQIFTSRARIVRELDDINRQFVNSLSDIPSPSKLITRIDVFQGKKTKRTLPSRMETICKRWREKVKVMRADLDETTDPNEILRIIQKYKVANCGELTDILEAQLKKKGYRTQRVNLIIRTTGTTRRQTKDHSFILVNPKNKFKFYDPSSWGTGSVVVDPWLGFVSRKDEAISKYTSYFDLDDSEFFIWTPST